MGTLPIPTCKNYPLINSPPQKLSAPSHSPNLKPTPRITETQRQSFFPSRFGFPKGLITNAESLSFDKLTELKVLSELNQIDVIAVTEVQSHDQSSLCLSNLSEFMKLRRLDYPLGKKEGGVMLFF